MQLVIKSETNFKIKILKTTPIYFFINYNQILIEYLNEFERTAYISQTHHKP